MASKRTRWVPCVPARRSEKPGAGNGEGSVSSIAQFSAGSLEMHEAWSLFEVMYSHNGVDALCGAGTQEKGCGTRQASGNKPRIGPCEDQRP